MSTGMSISRGVSVGIGVVRGTASEGKIGLRLVLFSTSARMASVALLYRNSFLDGWRTDARITASNARFTSGNEMHGLPCSPQGSESRLTWDHSANGVAAGARLHVKAVVVPSVGVPCSAGSFSRTETAFKGGDRDIGPGSRDVIVGFDPVGNAVVVGDHLASLVDLDSGSVEMVARVAGNVAHAAGTARGLIVAETNGTLSEFDLDGNVLMSLDASAHAGGDVSLSVHHSARTVLVSGGNVPKVTEVYWGGESHGTVLWSHDCPADSLPSGATYGDDLGAVLFCERGGGRIAVIDRIAQPQSVSYVSSVSVGGQSTPLSRPSRCAMSGGTIYVVEESGARRAFGATPSSHPAMARSGMAAASGEDALPQYSGMCFVPIVRSVK